MRARVLVLLVVLLWSGPAQASDAGPWVWPVPGTPGVARPFDPPETRYSAGHRGADVAAAVGSPVLAAGAGRVSYAGLLAGRGVVVVVHGSLRTTYEPVTASVRVGQEVAAGAALGRLAAGGHCADGCLHWGLRRGEEYLDPVRLVRREPSRLLPLDGAAGAVGAAARRASPAPAAPLEPVAEPRLSLRAGQLPWGLTAILALLAGLVLLRRPAPGPRRPPEVGVVEVPIAAGTVDLAAERVRRRAG